MRRLTTLLFVLMLVGTACSEAEGTDDVTTTTTTSVAAADDSAEDVAAEGDDHSEGAHEEGDDHSEEADEPEDAHEEGDDHSEGAHEEGDDHAEDAHGAEVAGMFASEENIPEAQGEVTAEHEVHMTEFGFDPQHLDLTPGETVRLTLVNEGLLGHEFRLTTEHKAEEHVASGHDDHGDEGGHHEDADIVINVAPGETRVVEMTLPAEASAINHAACLIPGHYEAGMFGTITY